MAEPAARLVVTGPAELAGQVLALPDPYTTIGRADTTRRVEHPAVSRRHAAVHRIGATHVLEDLGSTSGTRVNGAPLVGPYTLHGGDVVQFGPVALRYDVGVDPRGQQPPPPSAPTAAVSYSVGAQNAEVVNNVGRDQYNHAMTVVQQRESFLREVAATRTVARRLIWIGLLLFVVGFGLFVFTAFSWIQRLPSMTYDSGSTLDSLPFYWHGLPLGFVGWGTAAFGGLLIVVGIVRHVVATSRRRRYDRDHPGIALAAAPHGAWR